MVPTQADLSVMMGLEPKAAIAYLERKGFAITWDWHEVDEATHARSFTVAKAARIDILQSIRVALIDNMRAGKTLADFQRELQPTLEAQGWWGKKIIVNAQGEAQQVTQGTPRRLATIYQTNMQSAYMAGRYQAALAAVKTHPYWMYIAINDNRTRPSHRALHGKVYRWDDPIWQYILPPNGYNCRCRFIALTEREVKRRGLKVESSIGNTSFKTVDTGTNKQTGEVSTANVIVLRTTDQAGKRVTFSPDPGFNGSPVQSHLFDEYLYNKAAQTLGTAGATAEVQSTLLSPIRQRAWDAWIDSSTKFGYSQSRTMTFGVMHPQELAYAKAQNVDIPSPIMFLEDRQFVGPKYRRHLNAGDALTLDDLKALPQQVAKAQAVYWDVRNKTLLYVYPASDGMVGKVAVRFAKLQVGESPANDVATAYKVNQAEIDSQVARGLYVLIRGQ